MVSWMSGKMPREYDERYHTTPQIDEKIIQLRDEGWKYKDIAAETGVSISQCCQIYNGRRKQKPVFYIQDPEKHHRAMKKLYEKRKRLWLEGKII